MTDIKLTYQGSVKDGTIKLPQRLRKEVAGAFDGKQIEVTFKRKRKRRSNQQNAYYWGVMIPAIVEAMIDLGNDALQTGNTEHIDAVHYFLKKKFLTNGTEVFGVDSDCIQLVGSTTLCTTTEFMEYIGKIQQWAAEFLNIYIPDPNEQLSVF